MLPRNPDRSGDVVQGQVGSKLLPDKLLHFRKRRLRTRIRLFAAPHGRGKVAHQGKAESQIESRLERRFGEGPKQRSPAQLEKRMHASGEWNRSPERVKLLLERGWNSLGVDGEPTVMSFM